MEINQQVSAIVTGGASGLGEATARKLAENGARVAVFDMNEEQGNAVASDIGGVFCKVDVSDEESVEAALRAARKAHGQERILINCAGIGIAEKTASLNRETGKPQAHRMASFLKTIQVNLIGTFQMTAKSTAGMLGLDPHNENGGRGVVVNTASVAGVEGQVGQVAYSASKGGILGMTLPMARDLARDGIRVCTIMPGLFKTPLLASLPQDYQDSLGASIPHPSRLGDPSEFGDLAIHIVENEMMNGESIRIDGALRMAPR